MGRKKKIVLPVEGSAFAFPAGDGRFAVCRVLVGATETHPDKRGFDSILIASSDWLGDSVPSVDEPAIRSILAPTHHAWDGRPNVVWAYDEPPPELVPIGHLGPTGKEKKMRCAVHGSWKSVMIQPLLQWRWDHEREAVLAEDAQKENSALVTRKKEQRVRNKYLESVTLEDLRTHVFFRRWTDYPSAKVIAASRAIMSRTVKDLLVLGSQASEAERMAVLQTCIELFNEIDAKQGWIETIEREAICEEFEAIVHACGLGHYKDLADEWRDW
jgi:hypothetical protein